jgi:hypothetical protein
MGRAPSDWLNYRDGRPRGQRYSAPGVALVGADGAGRGQHARDQVALDRLIGAWAVDRRLRVAGALDREQAGAGVLRLKGPA